MQRFYREFPDGSIQTEPVRVDPDLVVFMARVYRDPADPHPTTGWAYERPDPDGEGIGPALPRCEAAAIGRALANRDLACGARPSREEMEKVVRMERRLAAERTGVDATRRHA